MVTPDDGQDVRAASAAALAPGGRLRAAINRANPVLYAADASGATGGVAMDLATELARRLGVALEPVPLASARECVQAVQDGSAAVGFFAIDPLRGDTLHFTPPYVVMEGVYVVPEHSSIMTNEDVDRPGHRVAVGAGSAYALFLARALKHAHIVDVPTSPQVMDSFVQQGLDAAAGVRQQMRTDMARYPGLRLLDGRFMAIHQSMAAARRHGADVHGWLNACIEDLKHASFVAASLARHRVEGADVAPAGYPAP
jgi:polar amino acid transport system substrate-binding protein